VWFDALVNYISAIGWPTDMEKFKKWWPVVQVAGKDQVRMQAGMWQAMLLSAGLPPSKQILIHGFITSGGKKMSKSVGNVVSPFDVVDEYGTDALRYYLLREIHPFEDGDFTMEHLREVYNANLANGLGNLTSRVMKMAQEYLEKPDAFGEVPLPDKYRRALDEYRLNEAMDYIWERIAEIDKLVQEKEPFKLIKDDRAEGMRVMVELVERLYDISVLLKPFMPETSKKIKKAIEENKKPTESLFPRKD